MIHRILVIVLVVAISFPHSQALAQKGTREFLSGYAGSLPGEPALRARTYFNNPSVRNLIYKLENGPLSRAEIVAALSDTDVNIDDLIRVKLIHEMSGEFYIGFNYFTADDMRSIHRATEKYVPKLVAAYAAKDAELEDILSPYPQHSVDPDLLKFVLIAGMSLNWDGLKITLDKNLRRTDFVSGENLDGSEWNYSFWASERVSEHNNKSYFWGSSTFPGGAYNFSKNPVDFSFSSFGDPYSDPRMNFPDLLYLPAEKMSENVRNLAMDIGLADREELGARFNNALGLELARPVSAILFALRDHPRSFSMLHHIAGFADKSRTTDVLNLLEEIKYVEKRNSDYVLLVPVFDYADDEMIKAAVGLSRKIISEWLDENYQLIRNDLAEMTSLKHGVPYEALFTQIWHEFFGRATRDLVAAGLLADPYDAALQYPGSFSMLWRMALYDFTPG